MCARFHGSCMKAKQASRRRIRTRDEIEIYHGRNVKTPKPQVVLPSLSDLGPKSVCLVQGGVKRKSWYHENAVLCDTRA